jgi:N6-adenosine-specific RNA methylase IME4
VNDLILTKVDWARRLLAQAKDATDAKRVMDMAHAAEIYAKRQKLSDEVIGYAHEIKIEAQRLLGEFLEQQPKNTGTRSQLKGRDSSGGSQVEPPENTTPTLASAGLTKKESSQAQFVAKIATESPEDFEAIKEGKKTVTQVKRTLKEEKREQQRQANAAKVANVKVVTEAVTGVFSTIVIDCPWDWGDEGDVNQMGRAKPDYATVPIDQLKKLPVGKLAADNCHLYMWITNRSLPKGFELIGKWGFRYITCLTWCKPSFGMGNYFRGSTEHILFAVKGNLGLRRRDVGTWFSAERPGKHSGKPDEAYALIESCSPGPYLEMFERTERKGWKQWGENSR